MDMTIIPVGRQEAIREIFTVEPIIPEMLTRIAQLPTNPEMNRWQRYSELKRLFSPYVGWQARNNELATSRHYEAFIDLLDALLPEDE